MPDPIGHDDVAAAELALNTKADAKSRGWRTALQFAIVGVAVDGIVIANGLLDSLDDGDPIDWSVPARALLRVVLGGGLAVLMRYQAPPPTTD